MEPDDLEIFENVAYCMAKHVDPSIPGTIDEWLDQGRVGEREPGVWPMMWSCSRILFCSDGLEPLIFKEDLTMMRFVNLYLGRINWYATIM